MEVPVPIVVINQGLLVMLQQHLNLMQRMQSYSESLSHSSFLIQTQGSLLNQPCFLPELSGCSHGLLGIPSPSTAAQISLLTDDALMFCRDVNIQ